MTRSVMALALGTMLVATPALAKGDAVGKAGAKKSVTADQKKYCISYENIVGSRVTKTECKTKTEWAKEDVDVDQLLND